MRSTGDKDYLAAYADLVGALQWAESKHYKHIVAWGSSYSSSLVFKLAAEHPEVNAVLSFSPGEYMDDKSIVKKWAAGVKVPVLIASTKEEWKDQAEAIYFAVPDADKMSVATDSGIHGSSTLIPDKNPKGNAEYWKSVDAFFEKLKKTWGS